MLAKFSGKVYPVVKNQRGNTSTIGIMWVIGGAVLFVLNMLVNFSRRMYLVANNQRGNTNTSGMMWIIGGAVLFVLILGFAKGWIPELWQSLKEKVNGVL